jgi:prevent-host-death family protein
MSTYPIAEAKSHFSDLIKQVEGGETVLITRGTKKEEVAVLMPVQEWREQTARQRKEKRRLGSLQDKMSVSFANDWHLSDEELLSS